MTWDSGSSPLTKALGGATAVLRTVARPVGTVVAVAPCALQSAGNALSAVSRGGGSSGSTGSCSRQVGPALGESFVGDLADPGQWGEQAISTAVPALRLGRLRKLENAVDDATDATKALPAARQIEAAWGAGVYKHGGLMSSIEHINYRHGFQSGFKNVSRFSEGTSVRQIKQYVDDALRYGAVQEGTINYNLGRAIGTDGAGNAVTGIRVHIREGIIRTAYPVAP